MHLGREVADLLLAPVSNASSLPNNRLLGAPPAQAAICSDPAQRFTLKKQIEEAEARLRELA